MQDIFLSTPATSGGAPGLSVAGGASSGLPQQEPGSTTSFGATLTSVFNTSLDPQQIEDISAKLESLGLDTNFLGDINALLSGNLMSQQQGVEGMPLPQLNSFLSSSLAELEKSLELVGDYSEGMSDQDLSALLGIINSIQEVIQPQVLQPGVLGYQMLETADAGAIANSQSNSLDDSGMKKQAQSKISPAMAQAALANTSQTGSLALGPNAEGASMLSGVQLTNQNIQTGQVVGEQVSQTLSNESFGKLFAESSANTNMVDALVDKVANTGVDKSGLSGIKASFADVQAKLDSSPYSTTVMTGLDDVEWGQEVSQKVVWLTGKAIQSAEIHLNPAELGPIDVKISVQNDAASVTFNAHNASVREMLESNVVRLREMMETNGVDLQEVNVDARQGEEGYASKDQEKQSGDNQDHDDEALGDEDGRTEAIVNSSSSNIVDYFA